MEPWQRVWIDATKYSADIHSYINCTACHGGQAADDKDTAHEGMVASPAAIADVTCGKCHPNLIEANANSLHSTLRGYDTVLYERSSPENFDTLEHMQQNHCNSCHTTCGDCHVSQPTSVGGGLLDGHAFVETPSMSRNCTACHGSRVKNEYYGANEGVPSDAHFRKRMACTDCHTGEEMHGIGDDADHRYDGIKTPSCESCHQNQIGIGSGIEQHEVHGTEILSCQACHSTSYTNCTNCHVEQSDEGVPFFTVEEHSLGFLLGRNVLQNAERPYRYVPVRHVPIDVNSFSFYGDNLLVNFDGRPTWTYATPHNIQRITPQSESCTNCHGNDAIFLTADKVEEAERAANQGVIVEKAPPLPEGYTPQPSAEASAAPSDSGGGDFWGGGDTATAAPTEGAESFWGEPAGTPIPSGGGDSFWGEDTEPESTPESEESFWDS